MRATLAFVFALAACDGAISTPAPAEAVDEPVAPVDAIEPATPGCTGLCVGLSATAHVTAIEYQNAVADVLDLRPDVSHLPADGAIGGAFFSNDATDVTADDADRYRASAEAIADTLLSGRYPADDARHPSARRLDVLLARLPACGVRRDHRCAWGFIARYGTALYRRPLGEAEMAALVGLYAWAVAPVVDPDLVKGAGGTFEDGLRYVIEQVLQAPRFLYRAERGTPTREPGVVALTSREVAARLAAFLLRSVPDAELARAGERGELTDPAAIAAQTRRLLDGAGGDRVWRGFSSEWLSTREMSHSLVRGLPEAEGRLTDEVSADLADEVSLTFEHLARNDGRLSTVLTSPGGVVMGDSLSWLVGATGPRASWVPQLPDRHGLLTLPGVLIANAHPGFTRAHHRGLFVRSRFLCQAIGTPNASLAAAVAAASATEENAPSAQTSRARLEAVTESSAVCASCHHLTNPIGYGLDGYDDLGRHRDTELGLDGMSYPIDSSGELAGRPDGELATDVDGKFDRGTVLLERLGHSKVVARCVARQLSRFALQREMQHDDEPSIDLAFRSFDKTGTDLRELVVAITQSDAFRHRRVDVP